jgi:hypothetical protein
MVIPMEEVVVILMVTVMETKVITMGIHMEGDIPMIKDMVTRTMDIRTKDLIHR